MNEFIRLTKQETHQEMR